MADILEDQRIHNIVKDYKRMYEQHDQLVADCEGKGIGCCQG